MGPTQLEQDLELARQGGARLCRNLPHSRRVTMIRNKVTAYPYCPFDPQGDSDCCIYKITTNKLTQPKTGETLILRYKVETLSQMQRA
jgi:hypothetical protein